MSRVYKLSWEQYDWIYFGETERNFDLRKNEYKRSREKENGKSVFGKLCNEEQHKGKGIFEVIHIENHSKRSKLWEQMEIALNLQ